MQAAGFVLVGGHSSRMGRDKALLRLDSHALVENVAARVLEVAGNIALIGPEEPYRTLQFECLPDLRPGLGPLAGIETALAAGRGDLNLIVACDMPGIRTAWLRQLLRRAEQSDAPCVAIRDEKRIVHPLCAVYRSSCLPEVQRALNDGRLRAQNLIGDLGAVFVEIGTSLENVNTPQEWAAWQQRRALTDGADAG